MDLLPFENDRVVREYSVNFRRTMPHAAQLLREPLRRNSTEPIQLDIEGIIAEREISRHRRSLPVVPPTGSRLSHGRLGSPLLEPSLGYASHHAENQASSIKIKRQWRLVDGLRLAGVREDYYSTLMASACSSQSGEDDNWAFLYDYAPQSRDEEIVSLNRLGEIIITEQNYVCRWTPQLGPQLFRHGICRDITCVALTRLGFCAIGDEEGFIHVFDLTRERVRTLARVHLCVVLGRFMGLHPGDPNLRQVHATHLTWSERTPVGRRNEYSRCGYRIEFFVGTSHGMVYKLFVNSVGDLVCDASIPLEFRHLDSIVSMALDTNQDTLVVTGIDRVISVWTQVVEQDGRTRLRPECRFNQFTAIKGVAFCPGLEQVVALGGGKKDRTLRLYDIEDRQLVCQVVMPAQIVGVVWVSRWEVFVALGHSRVNCYEGLGKVYNLSTGSVVCDIPGDGYALSAVKSRRGFCVYTSKQTLLEFSWRPEQSPKSAAATVAQLKLSYPPAGLR